ncbi:MAG: hypothetical protein ACOC1K_02225 [Nanoarchaeota archaeon]
MVLIIREEQIPFSGFKSTLNFVERTCKYACLYSVGHKTEIKIYDKYKFVYTYHIKISVVEFTQIVLDIKKLPLHKGL